MKRRVLIRTVAALGALAIILGAILPALAG